LPIPIFIRQQHAPPIRQKNVDDPCVHANCQRTLLGMMRLATLVAAAVGGLAGCASTWKTA